MSDAEQTVRLVGPRTRRRAAIGLWSREGFLAMLLAGIPCYVAQLIIMLFTSSSDPMEELVSMLIISLSWGIAAAIVYTRWIRVRTRLKIIKAIETRLGKFSYLSDELSIYLDHFAQVAQECFHVLNPGKDRGYFRLQELQRALATVVRKLETHLSSPDDRSLFEAIDLLEHSMEVQDSFSVGDQRMRKVFPLEIPKLIETLRADLDDVLRQRTDDAKSLRHIKEGNQRQAGGG